MFILLRSNYSILPWCEIFTVLLVNPYRLYCTSNASISTIGSTGFSWQLFHWSCPPRKFFRCARAYHFFSANQSLKSSKFRSKGEEFENFEHLNVHTADSKFLFLRFIIEETTYFLHLRTFYGRNAQNRYLFEKRICEEFLLHWSIKKKCKIFFICYTCNGSFFLFKNGTLPSLWYIGYREALKKKKNVFLKTEKKFGTVLHEFYSN